MQQSQVDRNLDGIDLVLAVEGLYFVVSLKGYNFVAEGRAWLGCYSRWFLYLSRWVV
jgi:hypothetical protein